MLDGDGLAEGEELVSNILQMADERCFLADKVRLVVQPLGPRAFIGEHA